MAKYIYTIKKGSPDEPWMKLNDNNYIIKIFTKDEIEFVMIPYRDFVHSLPGFQSSYTSIIDSVTMEIVTEFNTLDNANNALQLLAPPFTTDSIQDKLHQLVTKKRNDLNVNYTITNRVE